jgi:hypothetical protein
VAQCNRRLEVRADVGSTDLKEGGSAYESQEWWVGIHAARGNYEYGRRHGKAGMAILAEERLAVGVQMEWDVEVRE